MKGSWAQERVHCRHIGNRPNRGRPIAAKPDGTIGQPSLINPPQVIVRTRLEPALPARNLPHRPDLMSGTRTR